MANGEGDAGEKAPVVKHVSDAGQRVTREKRSIPAAAGNRAAWVKLHPADACVLTQPVSCGAGTIPYVEKRNVRGLI